MDLSAIGLISHADLCRLYSKSFVYSLRHGYGLVALGPGKTLGYDPADVVAAMRRHAAEHRAPSANRSAAR